MTGEGLCLLLLILNACMTRHAIRTDEARSIYDPCSDPGDVVINSISQETRKRESYPENIFGLQSVKEGMKILVAETMDLVTRLQRMHADNACLNSPTRKDNMFARIRSCSVYERIMTFNLSLFNEEYNITEWFDRVYVVEVTGQASTAAVLAYILNRSENEYTYKQLYRRVMHNIFDILCAVSDFWTGEEQEILNAVVSFSRSVSRRVGNPIDPTDSLILLGALKSRLQNINETSVAVE